MTPCLDWPLTISFKIYGEFKGFEDNRAQKIGKICKQEVPPFFSFRGETK